MTQEQYNQLVEISNTFTTIEDVAKYQEALTLDFHTKYQILQTRKYQLWQEKESALNISE